MGFTDLNKIFIRPLHLQEILTAYAGTTEVTDVIQDVLDDLNALIEAGTNVVVEGEDPSIFAPRTIIDGKCGGNGYYSKKEDTGNEDDAGIKRLCNSCGAWGKTEETNVPTKTWSIIEEPVTEV